MDKTREEFGVWMREAITDRSSIAYQEVYSFLVSCFVRADKDKNGKVTAAHFDTLVEEAASLPRKYGFAPKTSILYPSDKERLAARAEQFKQLDTNGSGFITLEDWISYTMDHITGKLNRKEQSTSIP